MRSTAKVRKHVFAGPDCRSVVSRSFLQETSDNCPPVAVTPERTLLNAKAKAGGQDRHEVNLGLRLFQAIRVVFRLRRIHRQVGQSAYKESLLRLRDAAHTKEDVALWKTHDLTDVSACTLSVEERKLFEQEGVHLLCENRRAGQFNGRRLGEDLPAPMAPHFVCGLWIALPALSAIHVTTMVV